jgi:hypothetical protein
MTELSADRIKYQSRNIYALIHKFNALPLQSVQNVRMKSQAEQIFVLVGKQVRSAMARFNRSGTIAIIDTPHGPVEFKTWHATERAAKLAATRKAKQ